MPYDTFLDHKYQYFDQGIAQPRFVYTHTGPGHSQNSGRCRNNEAELFEERLKIANQEMKDDIAHIEAVDPGAIIIINGDHGPYLTKNCTTLDEKYQGQDVNRLDLQDRYGAFLAIRLPQNDPIPPSNIETLADVFPEIFNYLSQTTAFNVFKPSTRTLKNVSAGVYIEDGIIHGGINDSEPLFIGQKK
ncbi:MAG: hypothetical protein ISP86_02420 [Shewanellaceae bacterium]|nr:hypothetical protein [Shewanellaceae bacterium]